MTAIDTALSVERSALKGLKQKHIQIPIRDETRIIRYINKCKDELKRDIATGKETRWECTK